MKTLLFLPNIGGYEFLVLLLLALLLFGGKKIPELARGIGKGIREFNSARANIESEIKEGIKEADKKKLQETLKEEEKA